MQTTQSLLSGILRLQHDIPLTLQPQADPTTGFSTGAALFESPMSS